MAVLGVELLSEYLNTQIPYEELQVDGRRRHLYSGVYEVIIKR